MTTRVISLLYIFSVFVSQAISYGDFYLFHLTTVMAVAFILYQIKDFKIFLVKNQTYYIILTSIVVWFSLTAFWNVDFSSTYKVLIQYYFSLSILGIMPYLMQKLERRDLTPLFLGLVGLHFILSLVEGFNILRWPISPYSPHKALFLKDAVQDYDYRTIQGLSFAPPTSLFWNPNNSAFVTLLLFPFFSKIKNRSLSLAFLACCLIFIIFSESKSLLVIAVAYLGIYFATSFGKKSLKLILGAAIPVLGLAFYLKDRIPRLKSSFEVFSGYVEGSLLVLSCHFKGVRFDDLEVHEKIRERMVLIDRALGHIDYWGIPGKGIGFLSDKSFFTKTAISIYLAFTILPSRSSSNPG